MAKSILRHFLLVAYELCLGRMTRQFVFGTSRRELRLSRRSEATMIWLFLWHSPMTARKLCQVRQTQQSESNGAEILPPLTGHNHWVRSVAFSPDDATVVSGSYDHTICIWSVTDGSMTRPPLRGHNGYIYSVAHSHNRSKIASGSGDNMVLVWDVVTAESETLPSVQGGDDEILCVAFSHNGSRIAAGLWERSNSRLEHRYWH